MQVEGGGRWEGDFVAVKEIRDEREISICGELVGDEARVGKCVAVDVCEEDDCVVGAWWGGVRDVCFDFVFGQKGD